MKSLIILCTLLLLPMCGGDEFKLSRGHPAHADTAPGAKLLFSNVLDLSKREPVGESQVSPSQKDMHHMPGMMDDDVMKPHGKQKKKTSPKQRRDDE